MTHEIDRKLGELSGQLKYFMPAVERVESKAEKGLQEAQRANTRLDNLKDDLDEHKKRAGEHHNLIYQKLEAKEEKGECADHDDIKHLQKQVDALKKENETAGNRKFEVWKIVLTAIVSALVPTIIAALVFFWNAPKGGTP